MRWALARPRSRCRKRAIARGRPRTAGGSCMDTTRHFLGYRARAVPNGPDDGTLAPWAVVASLPFAAEIVLPTLQHCLDCYPKTQNEYGLVCSINPTFPGSSHRRAGWISRGHFALDQGPVVLMIENYRSGLLWRLMRRCPVVVDGLRRAGFNHGWLTGGASPPLIESTRAMTLELSLDAAIVSGRSAARAERIAPCLVIRRCERPRFRHTRRTATGSPS